LILGYSIVLLAMLHLARITKKALLGKTELQILARQRSEYAWDVIADEQMMISTDVGAFSEGMLVLLDLSDDNEASNLQDATNWVLEVMGQYLAIGITPEQLQQEIERAEQWRQSLTLQSQEVGRRALETEARRDQIQQLEENIKKEKEEIERLEAALKEKYQRLNLDLDQPAADESANGVDTNGADTNSTGTNGTDASPSPSQTSDTSVEPAAED
jgi:DNA repair exonuclease SbcCD ATPase subunit